MADLSEEQRGAPAYIVDDTTGDKATVNANKEVLTHDATVLAGLENGDFTVIVNQASDTLDGKRFFSSTDISTKSGAAETTEVLVRNPAGSGIDMVLDRQVFNSTSNATLIFRLYTAPTITAVGTGLTVNNALISGSPPIAAGEMYVGPTASAHGTLFNVVQAFDQVVFDAITGKVVLTEGFDVLITIEGTGNNKNWSYDLEWVEESNA